jgi:type I restriction enzyme M protein
MARTAAAKNDSPKSTAQQLGSIVKACRDIMRKDKGLNGDLDRLPMLTWIMFLKFLDDLEQVRETEAKLAGKRYKPSIEPPYRWRDWAAKQEGITGPELIAFINQDEVMRPDGTRGLGLFAYLRSLESTNGDRRDVIARVFQGTVNRMLTGYLLRDVINKVNEIHFTSQDEIHTLGHLYETMLREMRDAAGDSGEFYTPRPVVKFIVSVVNPQLGETVLDPAAGTGGFLVEAFEHLRKQAKRAQDYERLQRSTFHGVEAKTLPYLLCQMNLLLHGLEYPDIDPGNALRVPIREIGRKDRVDVIMTNPPFGGEEERGILSNFPEDKQTSETALLYLQLIMRKLRKPGDSEQAGRAAVVVPDGTLSGSGIAAAIRKELLKDFNLYAVVQLPPGAFAPYAETARTNILFFDAAGSTDKIWYYQVLPPNGRKQCSKNNPLSEEDFRPVKDCWLGKAESPHSWFVSKSELDPVACELLRRNPKVAASTSDVNIETVVKRAAQTVQRALSNLLELEKSLLIDDATPRPLGELLRRSQRTCVLDDSKEYKQLTIQYHYRGVKLRGILKGSQISTKRQFSVSAGQMVLSRIDARYGALGFVPTELAGAVITGDFWAFDVNTAEVLPAYLDLFFGLPIFATLCERASRGTTRRQRLEPDLFTSIAIPWVPLDQQQIIIDKVGIAAGVAKLLEGVTEEVRGLPMELVNQSFGFAWIEENIERMYLSGAEQVAE